MREDIQQCEFKLFDREHHRLPCGDINTLVELLLWHRKNPADVATIKGNGISCAWFSLGHVFKAMISVYKF